MTNEPTDLTTHVLIQIRDSIAKLDANLSARLDQTNARIDHYLKLAGEAAREHEQWLRDHDVRIKRLEGHPPRRRPDGPPRRR